MPEFYMITARKTFVPFLWGHVPPAPVSYTYDGVGSFGEESDVKVERRLAVVLLLGADATKVYFRLSVMTLKIVNPVVYQQNFR